MENMAKSIITTEYMDGEQCLKLMEAMCLDHPQKQHRRSCISGVVSSGRSDWPEMRRNKQHMI